MRLFHATVILILVYGSETWKLTKEKTRGLDGTHTRLLRRALNIEFGQDRRRNLIYDDDDKITEK